FPFWENTMRRLNCVAGQPGFEPRCTESESDKSLCFQGSLLPYPRNNEGNNQTGNRQYHHSTRMRILVPTGHQGRVGLEEGVEHHDFSIGKGVCPYGDCA